MAIPLSPMRGGRTDDMYEGGRLLPATSTSAASPAIIVAIAIVSFFALAVSLGSLGLWVANSRTTITNTSITPPSPPGPPPFTLPPDSVVYTTDASDLAGLSLPDGYFVIGHNGHIPDAAPILNTGGLVTTPGPGSFGIGLTSYFGVGSVNHCGGDANNLCTAVGNQWGLLTGMTNISTSLLFNSSSAAATTAIFGGLVINDVVPHGVLYASTSHMVVGLPLLTGQLMGGSTGLDPVATVLTSPSGNVLINSATPGLITFDINISTLNITTPGLVGDNPNAFVYTNGTRAIVTSASAASGQWLLGNGTSFPVLGTLTSSGWLVVTPGPGTIAAGLPTTLLSASNQCGGGDGNNLCLAVFNQYGIATAFANISTTLLFNSTAAAASTPIFTGVRLTGVNMDAVLYTTASHDVAGLVLNTGQLMGGNTSNTPIAVSLTSPSGNVVIGTSIAGFITLDVNTSFLNLSTVVISGDTANAMVYTDSRRAIVTSASPLNGQWLMGNSSSNPVLGSIANAGGLVMIPGPGTFAIALISHFGVASLNQCGGGDGNTLCTFITDQWGITNSIANVSTALIFNSTAAAGATPIFTGMVLSGVVASSVVYTTATNHLAGLPLLTGQLIGGNTTGIPIATLLTSPSGNVIINSTIPGLITFDINTTVLNISSIIISGDNANAMVYTNSAKAIVTTASPGNGFWLMGNASSNPVLGTIANAGGLVMIPGPGTFAISLVSFFGVGSSNQCGGDGNNLCSLNVDQWGITTSISNISTSLIFTSSNAAAASPTFTGLTLSGLPANSVVYTTAGKALAGLSLLTGQVVGGSNGSIPIATSMISTTGNIIINGNMAGQIDFNLNTTFLNLSSIVISGDTANAMVYTNAGKSIVTTASPTNGFWLMGNTSNNPVLGTIANAGGLVMIPGPGTFSISLVSFFGVGSSNECGGFDGNTICSLNVNQWGITTNILNISTSLIFNSTNAAAASPVFTGLTLSNVVSNSVVYTTSTHVLAGLSLLTGQFVGGSNGSIPVATSLTSPFGTVIIGATTPGSITLDINTTSLNISALILYGDNANAFVYTNAAKSIVTTTAGLSGWWLMGNNGSSPSMGTLLNSGGLVITPSAGFISAGLISQFGGATNICGGDGNNICTYVANQFGVVTSMVNMSSSLIFSSSNAAAASPTFTGLTLSGVVAHSVLYANGAKALTGLTLGAAQFPFGVAGSDPVAGSLTVGGNLVLVTLSNGWNLNLTASPSVTGLTVTGLTNNAMVYTNGADAFTSLVLTSGQFPFGVTGSAPVAGSLTVGSNLVLVTLSNGWNLNLTSSPTVTGLTVAGLTNNAMVYTNGADALTSLVLGAGQFPFGVASAAPVAGSLTVGSNLVLVTLNNGWNLNLTASPTVTGLTVTGLTDNALVYTGGADALTSLVLTQGQVAGGGATAPVAITLSSTDHSIIIGTGTPGSITLQLNASAIPGSSFNFSATNTFIGTTNFQALGYVCSATSTTYSAGTVATSGSSTTVTGTSTGWDGFMQGGVIYITSGTNIGTSGFITTVQPNGTQLTVASPITIAAGSSYAICFSGLEMAEGYLGPLGLFVGSQNFSIVSPAATNFIGAANSLFNGPNINWYVGSVTQPARQFYFSSIHNLYDTWASYTDGSGTFFSSDTTGNYRLTSAVTGGHWTFQAATGVTVGAAVTFVTAIDIVGATSAVVMPVSLTLSAVSNQLIFGTTNTIQFNVAAPSSSQTITFSDPGGPAVVIYDKTTQTMTGTKNLVSQGYEVHSGSSVYNTGTAGTLGVSSQLVSSGSAPTWTASMVGGTFVFADGTFSSIVGIVNASELILATPLNEAGRHLPIPSIPVLVRRPLEYHRGSATTRATFALRVL